VRAVHSWNAEENGPMVAINDTLGFRAVERLVEMQRKPLTPQPRADSALASLDTRVRS
jgi:hypothetical protein